VAAISETSQATVRTSESPKLHPIARLRDIWSFREVLMNLIRKELKVKYTKSVIGAAWSTLNPIMYLIVFSFVAIMLGAKLPAFPVYLLSGLIAWNFFSGSLTLATRSIVDNTSLVKKVYFPKEILPIAAVGTAVVDFVLQLGVLVVFMLLFRYSFFGWNTLLLLPAFVALMIFTLAISFWLASVNVTYRDVQHLLNLILLAWFWLTPIVYPGALLQTKLQSIHVAGTTLFTFYFLNPLGSIVFGFQRALYKTVEPIGTNGKPVAVLPDLTLQQLWIILAIVIVGGIGVLFWCWRTFFRLSGDFAEEL
jgi:ABC-2 type transport system permease protein